MHRIALLILVLIITAIFSGCTRTDEPAAAVKIGEAAPDFTLLDVEGRSVTLSSLRGKVVLLNFWATWCPPCRAEKPTMERLSEALSGEDFIVLAVNTENDLGAVREWVSRNPYSFPILLDNEGVVQTRYRVFRFPETFLIGKDGKVLQHYIGARDWSSVEFLSYAHSLLKE